MAWAWVLHPVSVTALLVLLLNDHVLKTAWPGPLTGKLSDVAGLALAPPVITAAISLLVPRLPVRRVAGAAVVTIGMAFALAKVSATGASVVTGVWSWAWGPVIVRRDPTDLLALPALAISWWAWRRVRRYPLQRSVFELVRVGVLLPVAALAIVASSAGEYPDARDVVVKDGLLIVATGDFDYGYSTNSSFAGAGGGVVTRDGKSWSNADLSRVDLFQPGGAPARRATTACVPSAPRHCFHIVRGRLAVQESLDGGSTWADSWSVPPGRQRFLARAYPEGQPDGRSVGAGAVAVLPLGDQYLVAVAIGRDGILERHPDGRWERIGFPTVQSRDLGLGAPGAPQPLTDPGHRIAPEYLYVGLAVALGLLLGGLAAAYPWRRNGWVAPAASTGYVFIVVPIGLIGAVLGVTWVPGSIGLIGAALLFWWALAWSVRGLGLLSSTVLTVLAAVVVVVGTQPFVAWSSGGTDDYEAAVRRASYLVGGGIVVMLLAGIGLHLLARRHPPQPPASVTPAPPTGW